jgi:hypothetical protein
VVLEHGSGPGFFKELAPSAITSEILRCGNVDLMADAQRLPFPDASPRAIDMANVLHHIPDLRRFLAECIPAIRLDAQSPIHAPFQGIAVRLGIACDNRLRTRTMLT